MSFQQKRDWKRYDPKPPDCPKCSLAEWEVVVWVITAMIALPLLLAILTGGSE